MLIREGATLIQSADDVLELICHFDDRAEAEQVCDPSGVESNTFPLAESESSTMNQSDRAPVLDLLSFTPVPVDELVRQSGLPTSTVQLALLELELAGRLTRHAGARVSLSDCAPTAASICDHH